MEPRKDLEILRPLAEEYAAAPADDKWRKRREKWRAINSLRGKEPVIWAADFAWSEMPESRTRCEDPLFRSLEGQLRQKLFAAKIGDDMVLEPWLTLAPEWESRGWGVEIKSVRPEEAGGAFKTEAPLKERADWKKLRTPRHAIDEARTAEKFRRATDAIGDILTINASRAPASEYRYFSGAMCQLRGFEDLMMDMIDAPDWTRDFAAFLSAGVEKAESEAEKAGDFSLTDGAHAFGYRDELADPTPNTRGVSRKQLWGWAEGQDYSDVSPAMFEEFVLRYQIPILEKYGLTIYGCCENITPKIDLLRKIPNLRVIVVSPFSDPAKCAEQIGDRYVPCYRPSPADMVSYGFNPDRVRKVLRRDLSAFKANGCCPIIQMVGAMTVEKDRDRVAKWVQLVREVISKIW